MKPTHKLTIIAVILFLAVAINSAFASAETTIFFEGFEDGTLGNFTADDNDFKIQTNKVYVGSYSIGIEDYDSDQTVASATPFPNGSKPLSFSFYWLESSSSNGGGVRLFDSNGNNVVSFASDNPGWVLDDGGGVTEIKGDDSEYDMWNFVEFDFDWDAGTYNYSVERLSDGLTRTGTRNLDSTQDIKTIEIQSYNDGAGGWPGNPTHAFYMWFDNFKFKDSGSSKFSINAKNVHNNELITNFSAVVNGTTYDDSGTGSIQTDIAKNETSTFNITVSKTTFEDYSISNYNVSNSTASLEVNLTSLYTYLTVTATSYNGSSIENFTTSANSANSSSSDTVSTGDGSALLQLEWNETYNISIDAPGYALYNNYNTTIMENYSVSLEMGPLYMTNTVNFTFKNETSNALVTNVEVDLIGEVSSNNYTTGSDSNLILEMINPSQYTILYTADGFLQRQFAFELTDRSFLNYTLYLTDSSAGSNVTATVYDQIGNTLEEATIEVLKYDSSLGSYKVVTQAITNWQGITQLSLFKNDVYYKFRIYYEDELRQTTNPTYIYQDTISFQIRTDENVANDYFTVEGINYDLVWNPTTENFRFDYTDPSASTVQFACLRVEKTSGITTTDYNDSCLTATSGTILVGAELMNNTQYTARAYVSFGDEEYFIDSITIGKLGDGIDNNIGLFMIVLLTVVFAFMGLWNPVAAITLTPMPFIMGSFIGFISIPMGPLIFLEAIALVLAILVGKRA